MLIAIVNGRLKMEVMTERKSTITQDNSSPRIETTGRNHPSPALMRKIVRNHRSVLMRLLWIIGILNCVFLLVEISSWEDGRIFLNAAGPICLGAACSWGAIKLFMLDISVIWMPIPWLLCSLVLFFGLGSLLYVFGPEDAIMVANELHAVGIYELFRTNQLNLVGVFCIIAAFLVMSQILKLDSPKWLQSNRSDHKLDEVAVTKVMVIFFGLIGVPLHYLVVLPSQFGMFDFILPGSLRSLDQLNILNLFLLGYLAGRCGREWTILYCSFYLLQTLTVFALFNKEPIILNTMLAGLGLYFGTRRRSVFVLTLVFVFLVYVWITPLINYNRAIVNSYYGENPQVSFSERMSITAEGLSLQFNDELPQPRNITYPWWSRLSHSNVQAFAMNLYDSGEPGSSFDNLYYYFVPRFIYPDKPILSDVGRDITELAFGHRNSSTGLTVFGDLYWHGGWLFVVCGCVFIGVFFTCLSVVALRMLGSSDWLLLPCSALGILLGLRVDGWFVQAYLGTLFIFVGYLFVISWFRPFVQSVAATLQSRQEALQLR